MVGKRLTPSLEESAKDIETLRTSLLARCDENEAKSNLTMKVRVVDVRTLLDQRLERT